MNSCGFINRTSKRKEKQRKFKKGAFACFEKLNKI